MSELNLDEIRESLGRYKAPGTAGFPALALLRGQTVIAQIPALLEEVERLREQNANLREQLDRVNAGRQTLAEELAGGEPR